MDGNFPMESFQAAFREAQNYPSQGARSMHDGVPSRPTLARYAAMSAIGFDPGEGSPINSANKTVVATVIKLATASDRPVPEIGRTGSEQSLRRQARKEVLERYPDARETLPEGTFTTSHNYVFDVISALCAADYNVDPVAATDANLDGKTRYLDT